MHRFERGFGPGGPRRPDGFRTMMEIGWLRAMGEHGRGFGRESGRFGGHQGGERRGRGGGRGRHGGPFDYGDLRLLVLAMLAEKPSHGYELMKTIEERFEGRYSPSPGLIYPTLSWLEDMGLIALSPAVGGRKSYEITEAGRAFLEEQRERVDAILQRVASGEIGRGDVPEEIVSAMGDLKRALRSRLSGSRPSQEDIARFAETIRNAARTINHPE